MQTINMRFNIALGACPAGIMSNLYDLSITLMLVNTMRRMIIASASENYSIGGDDMLLQIIGFILLGVVLDSFYL